MDIRGFGDNALYKSTFYLLTYMGKERLGLAPWDGIGWPPTHTSAPTWIWSLDSPAQFVSKISRPDPTGRPARAEL